VRGNSFSRRPSASSLDRRGGFTLIEMLVSLAITLIMMAAVVSLFGLISENVSGSRSVIETAERLRAARNRLQADLQGITAPMRPPLRPEDDAGYFEYIEGRDTDRAHANAGDIFGDADDVLMFTTRSRGEPFVGKYLPKTGIPTTVESYDAEVIYFCAPPRDINGNDIGPVVDVTSGARLWTLYRRVLLVSPGLINSGQFPDGANPEYYDNNDVSARVAGTTSPFPMLPNTLGDLSKRENRFAHYPTPGSVSGGFPFDIGDPPATGPTNNTRLERFGGVRYGDDVLLNNVLAFDVQVYDPQSPIQVNISNALTASDPGFTAGTGSVGAYVDLGTPGYAGPFSQSSQQPIGAGIGPLAPALPMPNSQPAVTYDTWSLHYENNGENENNDALVDEGTNGIDDDGDGLVDESTDATNTPETETHPPYAAPLRGIKITIRVYEPGSQQVRQMTVVQDFLRD
jgi:prepilin-type N-terminal cleavage/methylation domain-containing protein